MKLNNKNNKVVKEDVNFASKKLKCKVCGEYHTGVYSANVCCEILKVFFKRPVTLISERRGT